MDSDFNRPNLRDFINVDLQITKFNIGIRLDFGFKMI